MRVLLVEDVAENVAFCRLALGGEGASLDALSDVDAAFERLADGGYDLAVLDVTRGTYDGCSFTQRARKSGVTTPILLLTPFGSAEERVRGLDSGADDCLSAPFNERELRARVRALVRRHKRLPDFFLEVGPVRVDLAAQTVLADGAEVQLAPTEYRLLTYLMRNAGAILSRDQILDRVWGSDFAHSPNIVDVYVRHLRLKLQSIGIDNFITTVWGTGYRVSRHRRQSSVA